MKNNLLAILLTLLTTAPVAAQHPAGPASHKHTSPHGGLVKTAGNYHLELLQKAGVLTVYLLDANEKTMPLAGMSATALLQTPAGQVTTAKLIPTAAGQFVVTLDKTKSFHKALINVTVKGQSASASFDLMGAKISNGQAPQKH